MQPAGKDEVMNLRRCMQWCVKLKLHSKIISCVCVCARARVCVCVFARACVCARVVDLLEDNVICPTHCLHAFSRPVPEDVHLIQRFCFQFTVSACSGVEWSKVPKQDGHSNIFCTRALDKVVMSWKQSGSNLHPRSAQLQKHVCNKLIKTGIHATCELAWHYWGASFYIQFASFYIQFACATDWAASTD